MKRPLSTKHNSKNRIPTDFRMDNRRGSTLLVVLALLGLLSLLGFAFYTFASQERATAEYFAANARVTTIPNQANDPFHWPLQQLILGPDDSCFNSVLWGGRHSLVPNMVGRDGIPYNGEGINLSANASGIPFVDMQFNGTPGLPQFLNPVDAPLANAGFQWGSGKSPLGTLPSPDVDYSYPDINNMALSYDGFALNAANQQFRTFIPSFFRPQYLRSGTATVSDWYNNPTAVTASQSFRPHPNHIYIDSNGNPSLNRYVQTDADATALGLTKPFSFVPLDDFGKPTMGELGVWTNPSLPETFNLDVDTDGDGIRESILMDLGHPPIRRGDGKLMVPLFAFQVRDLNGLINLNAATSKLTKNPLPPDLVNQEFGADSTTGNPGYLSSSNQGLTASEINPVYGLTANPASVSSRDTAQHRYFLKSLGADRGAGGTILSARELANLEWFFLAKGRVAYDASIAESLPAGAMLMSPAIVGSKPGLYGDVDRLVTYLSTGSSPLPEPGVIGTRDNFDSSTPMTPYQWTSAGAAFPMFGSPIDYAGAGSVLLATDPFGKNLNHYTRAANSGIGPNRWLVYQRFHSAGDVVLQSSPYAGQLLLNSYSQLSDHPAEMIIDDHAISLAKSLPAGHSTRGIVESDATLGPLETAFLQQSNSDSYAIQSSSRVASLMPINTVVSPEAREIRPRYTTLSNNRREFGKTTEWIPATQALPAVRAWESQIFPPTFATRPYRPLLWFYMGNNISTTMKSAQLRLSANQLVTDQDGNPYPAGVPTGIVLRDLIPHPTGLSANAVASVPFTMSPATPEAQEYLARRDRQAMARDIYVLLYLFGGNQDMNPLTTPGATLYTEQQLKDMAQFAVNYVDALDRDSVMTRFEYDTDLSNGWNLDDDAYTTTESDRAEVWGVERQELTFSEVLAIRAVQVNTAAATPFDHPATEYDDRENRYFTYVQLQSTSPYSVDLSTGAWQVRLLPKGAATTPAADERRLTVLNGQVNAGSFYTIMSAGDATNVDPMTGMPRPSYFQVDPDYVNGGSGTPRLIAPSILPNAAQKLDLITDSTTQYRLTDGNNANKPTLGDLLNDDNTDVANTTPIYVTLMRRAHPDRTAPAAGNTSQEDDNPWVEVDRMSLASAGGGGGGLRVLTLEEMTDRNSTPSISMLLEDLKSRYRYEPFAAGDEEQDAVAVSSIANYLASNEQPDASGASPPTAAARYAHYHLDRPFASVGEILELPIVGPGLYQPTDPWHLASETWHLTSALRYANDSPTEQFTNHSRALTGPGAFFNANGAANRWYRLFEFLEVPSPMHRHQDLSLYTRNTWHLPVNFGWPRVSGQLNLNMVRHPTVLGGLLDDNRVLNLPAASGFYLPARDGGDGRDWWEQFIHSRDSFDGATIDPVTGLFVPGTAGARPFRGFGFTSRGADSQNDTLFRTLPVDTGQADRRMLFQIGQHTEHANGTLDSVARNRLLSKIMNNVTTRTNSYGVFIGIQYFEAAVDPGTGAIRIGGRIDETPTQRAFFVIDRTSAVEQIKALRAAGTNFVSDDSYQILPDTSTTAVPNGVNWQSLIRYQQTLN
jgi:hypothetical protein